MNVLGTDYKIIIDSEYCISEGADGFCQRYEKRIYMREVQDMLEKNASSQAKQKRFNEVLRHELIHAFLFEAGLDEYGCDETIVQWIASKIPQIINCFNELKCAE